MTPTVIDQLGDIDPLQRPCGLRAQQMERHRYENDRRTQAAAWQCHGGTSGAGVREGMASDASDSEGRSNPQREPLGVLLAAGDVESDCNDLLGADVAAVSDTKQCQRRTLTQKLSHTRVTTRLRLVKLKLAVE